MELDRRDDPIERRSTQAGRARVVAASWLDGGRSSPASVSALQRRIVAWFGRAFDQPVWVTGEIVDVDLRDTWCRLQLVSPESDRGFVSDPAAEASQVWTFVGTRELWSIARYLRSRGRGLDDFFRIGNRISLRGTVRYWEQGSRFEVAVDIVDARTGEGWLAGWRRITARRLEREGLFARQRSRCPPPIPTRLAVVSTRFGEARRDVRAVLRRADLDWVADDGSFALSRLEGAGAAEHIAERITAAAASGVDAVVVTRGGGDRLALAVFDAECVVRAIAEAPVPIITGIGHAADLTLADRAAWQHASTPTDAADAVVHAHRAASGEIDRVHGEIDDAGGRPRCASRRRGATASRSRLGRRSRC
ncbi:MAG: exodeoxyribonuclease VII large subunit [Candidatus Dormiibacterota bacterium]